MGTVITVTYATASALLNMACLIAIGFAFGYEQVGPMIAAFALATISVLLSPTPQGVGVVEAAIIAVLCSANCDLASATAISLVYRGIIFWIPFCIGAVMLSQSGFFKEKGERTEDARARDVGWITGTIVIILGIVNEVLAIVPSLLAPYSMLTQWVDFGNMFAGPMLIASGIVLVLIGVGLIFRLRMAWALGITVLTILGGLELLYYNTVIIGVLLIALAAWLFVKSSVFSRHLENLIENKKEKQA
jgi:phosphatidylglycerol lysyltransferase